MRFRALAAVTTIVVGLLVATTVAPAPRAEAAPRDDATYFEAHFSAGDGVNTLHADVLRPAGIGEDTRTPVILTVSPYLNHSGSTIEAGVTEEGPNERFYDFLDLTNILDRGYTYVMVDLPGFGGSSGCNDWGGNREQGAVEAAVEWAASQPWSTGKVGMLGKSYDAWTGLMGMAKDPDGLAAVVSMEPVFSGYNYLYNNGVRFLNSVATPALFQAIDAKPGSLTDSPQYHANGAPQAWCYGVNIAMQQQDQPETPFWLERDLLRATRGSDTPLFLTQGFLETNTKPDAAFDYFNGLAGEENRSWFGQFDHVRGWETTEDGSRTQTGRSVDAFIDQVMRFFDEHVKGEPRRAEPAVEVQDNLGRYRAETSWPPADATMLWNDLNAGSYADDNGNRATGSADETGNGVWSVSQPMPHRTWLAGEPVLTARVNAPAPRSNLVGLVYDIAPDGTARLINRGTTLLRGNGEQVATFELYGQDWVLAEGHRIGVLVAGSDASWWTHVPTGTTVSVESARIGLPFLTRDRRTFLDGGSTPRLERHLEQTAPVSASTITEAERTFTLPDRLRPGNRRGGGPSGSPRHPES